MILAPSTVLPANTLFSHCSLPHTVFSHRFKNDSSLTNSTISKNQKHFQIQWNQSSKYLFVTPGGGPGTSVDCCLWYDYHSGPQLLMWVQSLYIHRPPPQRHIHLIVFEPPQPIKTTSIGSRVGVFNTSWFNSWGTIGALSVHAIDPLSSMAYKDTLIPNVTSS